MMKEDTLKKALARDDKVREVKQKVELEVTDEIKHSKQLLHQLMQCSGTDYDKSIDLVISEIFILNSLLYWIKSDRFCKEVYSNGNFVLRDHQLDVILGESFNFIRSYMISLETKDEEIHGNAAVVGLTFTDKYISQSIISVFDEILYDKENNND